MSPRQPLSLRLRFSMTPWSVCRRSLSDLVQLGRNTRLAGLKRRHHLCLLGFEGWRASARWLVTSRLKVAGALQKMGWASRAKVFRAWAAWIRYSEELRTKAGDIVTAGFRRVQHTVFTATA